MLGSAPVPTKGRRSFVCLLHFQGSHNGGEHNFYVPWLVALLIVSRYMFSSKKTTSKIPQKQQRFADCKRVIGKLVLYLEPKATASCMDQPHPKYCQVSKDWGNRRMLGSPMEISNPPLLVPKSLLFPLCISKVDFKSSE